MLNYAMLINNLAFVPKTFLISFFLIAFHTERRRDTLRVKLDIGPTRLIRIAPKARGVSIIESHIYRRRSDVLPFGHALH